MGYLEIIPFPEIGLETSRLVTVGHISQKKKKKKSLVMQTLCAFPTHLSRGHPPALRKHFDFATQWAKDKSGGSTKGGR